MDVRRDIDAESGFTVAELVIAAAILFFVLTAIVGLVGVSTQMTVQAKQKSVLTNAVASYIDEVRSYSWEDISATDTDGDSVYVPSTVTRVVEGVSVTMSTAVEIKQVLGDEYMKYLRVTATAVLGGETQTMSTRVAIRNPSNNRTLSVDPDLPTIEFDSATPAENEVLYLNQRLTGGAVKIKTRAESPVATITSVRYEIGDRLLRDQPGAGGIDAIFEPSPPTAIVVNESRWDTRQDGVIDGFQTVTAVAQDDQARIATVKRTFIIDNIESLAPGTPSGEGLTSRSVRLSWNAARDGGTDAAPFYASQYQWTLFREPNAGGAISGWPEVANDVIQTAPSFAEAIQAGGSQSAVAVAPNSAPPFSRYFARVRSGSPRRLSTDGFADMASPVVARPEIFCSTTPAPYSAYNSTAATFIKSTGSQSSRYCEYTVVLWVSKPAFPNSAVSYDRIQYWDQANPGWVDLTPKTGSFSVDTSDPYAARVSFIQRDSGSTARRYYYRVLATVTPSGALGGTQVTVPTNAAGLTSTTHNQTVSLQPDQWTF